MLGGKTIRRWSERGHFPVAIWLALIIETSPHKDCKTLCPLWEMNPQPSENSTVVPPTQRQGQWSTFLYPLVVYAVSLFCNKPNSVPFHFTLEGWPNTKTSMVLTIERDDHASVEEAQQQCSIRERESDVQSYKSPKLSKWRLKQRTNNAK